MKLIKKIRLWWAKRNSQSYVSYLRSKGVKIGANTFIRDPKGFGIDLQRAHLITIGSNVRFNYNNRLIAHDAAAKVFQVKYHDYLPSNGHITIGNNVWFARDVRVLKNVTIGDNCIIGLGSVVTHDIPANSVAVGVPARVVCTLDEYYEKRQKEALQESFEFARGIVERYHRRPVPADFRESFVWFVSGKDLDKYPELPFKHQLGPAYEHYKAHHVAKFASFDEFLKAAGIEVK
ncbi:MAG: acyltransferase [Bacteroidaceae bacterium]|nr:acyltransferase [Bacteroidaceae bacterium]